MLRRRFAVDFTLYKAGTIGRRLERRMSLNAFSTLAEYVKHLESSPEEMESLYRDLLVEVTRFFRDRAAFDIIEGEVVPRLFEQASLDDGIRVWVPGCATGEEAYSLAILLHAYRESKKLPVDIKVFATDVHRTSLDIAANGVYGEHILNDIPPALLAHYFVRKREKYAVSPDLRQMVLFAPHNVAKDPPFTRLDLITCRNLLIYLNPPTQKKSPQPLPVRAEDRRVPLPRSEREPGGERRRVRDDQRAMEDLPQAAGCQAGVAARARSSRARRRPTLVNQRLAGATPPRSELAFPAVYEALLARFVPSGLLIDEDHQLLHAFGDGAAVSSAPRGPHHHRRPADGG